jgi:hypothetical protein
MLNIVNGQWTPIPSGLGSQRSMTNILGLPVSPTGGIANIGTPVQAPKTNILGLPVQASAPAPTPAPAAQDNSMRFQQSDNKTRAPNANLNVQNLMSRLPERAMAGQRGLVGNAMNNMPAPQLTIGSNNQQGRYPTINPYLEKFR